MYGYIGVQTDAPKQSGQTPYKEVKNQSLYCSWRVVPHQLHTVWPTKIGLFRVDSLSRHLPQLAYDLSICAVDKTCLIELVRDMPPFLNQRDKKYHNGDLKPKHWDDIWEKLNFAVKYWNNNTDELQYSTDFI